MTRLLYMYSPEKFLYDRVLATTLEGSRKVLATSLGRYVGKIEHVGGILGKCKNGLGWNLTNMRWKKLFWAETLGK